VQRRSGAVKGKPFQPPLPAMGQRYGCRSGAPQDVATFSLVNANLPRGSVSVAEEGSLGTNVVQTEATGRQNRIPEPSPRRGYVIRVNAAAREGACFCTEFAANRRTSVDMAP